MVGLTTDSKGKAIKVQKNKNTKPLIIAPNVVIQD
jgi:hypothetical protein